MSTKTVLKSVFGLVLSIWLGSAAIAAPLDMCEVLPKIESFRGKRVTLRGELFHGGHGYYLRGAGCKNPLQKGGYEWPLVLWISTSDRDAKQLGIDSVIVSRAWDELGRRLQRAREQGKLSADTPVVVTITGTIRTHEDLNFRVFRRGDEVLTDGFGSGGWAPGEFFLDTVDSISANGQVVE